MNRGTNQTNAHRGSSRRPSYPGELPRKVDRKRMAVEKKQAASLDRPLSKRPTGQKGKQLSRQMKQRWTSEGRVGSNEKNTRQQPRSSEERNARSAAQRRVQPSAARPKPPVYGRESMPQSGKRRPPLRQDEKGRKTVPVSSRKSKGSFGYAAMIGSLVLVALTIVGLAVVVGMNLSLGTIQGASMEPTLQEDDRVLYYKTQEVSRFDIVAIVSEESSQEQFIKRIIGMPGDIVSYETGELFINQVQITESYLQQAGTATTVIHEENRFGFADILRQTAQYANSDETTIASITKIPDDMYLVLGDNRNNSYDSRDFGLIKKEDIKGVVKIRFSSIFDVQYFTTNKNDIASAN